MHSMTLTNIKDDFYPHLKAIIDSFVADNKLQYKQKERYSYPQDVVVSSVEEVRRRVFEAEDRVKNGEFYTQDEYETIMNNFFEKELGIKR
ncbi:MAG: hypothetical protein HXX81_01225 [Campylobacterales bacterium]|nr:hypothetical protein [Campylobacterales bacterium]